uniref:Uncharacterized protein n=1 Tax=Salix viminalis TaxID=40686 RepID=A0A6N2LE65_SALVM
MRRRPVEFRRPVRRRISSVVWWTLCGISVLLFIVIFSKESHIESRPASLNKYKRWIYCNILREISNCKPRV